MAGPATRKRDQEAVEIGQSLTRIRKERGITQVELARRLGLPQQMVSSYERGRLRLHGQLIVKLASILGVTADEILGLEKLRERATTQDQRFLKRLRRIDRLTRRDQQVLLRTLDAFLERADLKKSA